MDKFTMEQYVSLTEAELSRFFDDEGDRTSQAMAYSLRAGGKRIRPVLCLEFCRLCGGEVRDALPVAVAIEMIHTYSLIHDDLPCMDDDDMRRGRPSCHKQFGEAYALLAGDGLLTYAFTHISASELAKKAPERALHIIRLLSECAGVYGMIGGQTLDIEEEAKKTAEDLRKTDLLKTGQLIKAACLCGCIAAGADKKVLAAAESFALNLGLAFQVVDDILDVKGDREVFGKPVGSDERSGKTTYVTLLGLQKAEAYAEELTKEALNALSVFGKEADLLRTFAASLLTRKN